mmetsp:Transcript_13594/g.54986  ORF Transcript_13594/g.54986 Transcript_13594/m.54986 type:complete len:203 (-) Transcript_13594:31-639(-)
MLCIGIMLPGSSAPTSLSSTSATARTPTCSTNRSTNRGLAWNHATHSPWRRLTRHATVLLKYPASMLFSLVPTGTSMNAMTRENKAQSSSVRALRMASISQLKISHARYGYLYSRFGSASAGGGSTRYETSFSTTGRVLRKSIRRLLRDLHSWMTSSSSRSSSSVKLSLSSTSPTGEACTNPGERQNMAPGADRGSGRPWVE